MQRCGFGSAHMVAMGIQICKVLGYALTDLDEDDARVNWDSPLLDSCSVRDSFADFAEHLPTVPHLDGEGISRSLALTPHRDLSDCAVYDPEHGRDDVLVLVPPSRSREWLRSGNIMDYVEAQIGGEPNMEPALKELASIHPYDGLWMDRHTGVELDPRFAQAFNRMISNDDATPEQLLAAARRIVPVPHSEEEQHALSRAFASDFAGTVPAGTPLYADPQVAAERITRLVPAEIRALAEYGSLFTHPGTWKQLHPVHYTFWS